MSRWRRLQTNLLICRWPGCIKNAKQRWSKEDAEKKSDFILTATPSVWKKMIKLDKGSAPKVIGLAPKSPAVLGAFNKIDPEWPDEMTPQRLQEYKAKVAEFRQRLGI
jgi:hypothetical protein